MQSNSRQALWQTDATLSWCHAINCSHTYTHPPTPITFFERERYSNFYVFTLLCLCGAHFIMCCYIALFKSITSTLLSVSYSIPPPPLLLLPWSFFRCAFSPSSLLFSIPFVVPIASPIMYTLSLCIAVLLFNVVLVEGLFFFCLCNINIQSGMS